MIKSIPKYMLIDEVTYKKYIEDTGEGSSFEEEVTLKNVKIDEQKNLTNGIGGIEILGNATLFYDLKNSSGLIDEPKNESKIIFNDKTYTIKSVDILKANSTTPHHYEILLK